MEENNIMCKVYNRRYCLPVYSGTLAIEGLLKSLSLNSSAKVLISSISCYSILESVLNSGLTPIIATPSNGILFEIDELESIILNENIKIYIAVHQYGYYQEIPKLDDLIVIEDLSQVWNLQTKDNVEISYKGDYLVQSLGKSKPLSNGIGGLILSNNNIAAYFDLKQKESRLCENKLLGYYYPFRINYKKIISKANRKVLKQRRNAKKFDKIFKKAKLVSIFKNDNYISTYHRYVIKVDKSFSKQLVDILNRTKVNYELEHKIKLNQLPIVNKYKIKTLNNNQFNDSIFILLKTNNSMFRLNRLRKEMEAFYE